MSSQIGMPEAYAAKRDGRGQRSGIEDALLVEDAVVRQLVLEPQLGAAVGDQRDRVVQTAVGAPGQRDEHGRRSGCALALELPQRRSRRVDERRPEHEVFRRIADEDQLGQDDEIGAEFGGPIARAPHASEVAGHVAHRGIQLRERD